MVAENWSYDNWAVNRSLFLIRQLRTDDFSHFPWATKFNILK